MCFNLSKHTESPVWEEVKITRWQNATLASEEKSTHFSITGHEHVQEEERIRELKNKNKNKKHSIRHKYTNFNKDCYLFRISTQGLSPLFKGSSRWQKWHEK